MRFLIWIISFCLLFACSSEHSGRPLVGQRAEALTLSFQKTVVDATASGDCKAVGDVDGDFRTDLLIAGASLTWYEAPTWTKHVVATAADQFTTFGTVADVDHDGDLDFMTADGGDAVWLENPLPAASATTTWSRHVIGTIGGFGKDVLPADYDADGRMDVAIRSGHFNGLPPVDFMLVFFQDAGDSWTRTEITQNNLGHEGAGAGDVDDDGFVDLIGQGAWFRNPGSLRARTDTWQTYTIDTGGTVNADFKALVANVDGQPGAEVLFSSSENTADVEWFGTSNPRGGTWTRHVIAASIERAHTLQAGDFDGDGVLDVVFAQLHISTAKQVWLYLNGGDGTAWTPQLVDSGEGIHNGVVADVDHDGFLDIFGANFIDGPYGARLWRSTTMVLPPPTDAGPDGASDAGVVSDAGSDAAPGTDGASDAAVAFDGGAGGAGDAASDATLLDAMSDAGLFDAGAGAGDGGLPVQCLIGTDAIGTNDNLYGTGYTETARFTSVAAGTVSRLRAFVAASNTATTVKLALYDDSSGPDVKFGDCSVTSPQNGAWNECSLASSVGVAAGVQYWIAIANDGAGAGHYLNVEGTGLSAYKAGASFPNPFGSVDGLWSATPSFCASP